jgi:predicted RNA-binding Zn-ribbon protein involved in translation (DUF1610 family)
MNEQEKVVELMCCGKERKVAVEGEGVVHCPECGKEYVLDEGEVVPTGRGLLLG